MWGSTVYVLWPAPLPWPFFGSETRQLLLDDWLNHATVKLESSVACPGRDNGFEIRIELHNLQI